MLKSYRFGLARMPFEGARPVDELYAWHFAGTDTVSFRIRMWWGGEWHWSAVMSERLSHYRRFGITTVPELIGDLYWVTAEL